MSADLESLLGADPTDESDEEAGPTLSRRQWALVGLGTLLVVGGLVAQFALGAAVAPDSGFLIVAAVASLAAVWSGYARLVATTPIREPPAVERRAGVERTGEGFETAVRQADHGNSREQGAGRVTVKRRLKPLAVRVTADADDCSEETATERVDDGTWTDDPVARRLFEGGERNGRLQKFLRRQPSITAQTRAVVGELGDVVLGGIGRPGLGDPPERKPSTGRRWRHERRETGRWLGVGAVGLAALGVAAVASNPGLVLVAAVLVGLAGYARLGVAPEPSLAVERSVSDADPSPGDHVTVTVSVRNAGDRLLPDLRVVDDVPPDLRVVDGSPSHATGLRPGERTTFSYDVLAVYGDHDFERLYTVTRDASGHHERIGSKKDGAVTLTCEPRTVRRSVPLHPQESGVVGRVASDVGGSGHEFHAVREYRRGDPLRRVDWNRVARTGELATLQFREEHAATVVVLVDTRAAAFRAPDADALSAVDRSLAGAAQVYASLQADGDRVGLANVGLDWTWIGPGAGTDHSRRVQDALGRDPNFSGASSTGTFSVSRYVRRLRRRLPSDAQLLLFSPLLDEESAALARRLHAHGHDVTAFSPDPTTAESMGGVVARIERTFALSKMRRAGIPVVDWSHDEPLPVAVERAERRWQR